MRVLIIGGTGMLGHKLVQVLSRENEVFTTIRRSFEDVGRFGIFKEKLTFTDINVTDPHAVNTVIEDINPDVVINAVGLIKHIASSKDLERMSMLNTELPQRLARLSGEHGFRFISVGTDCVYSGAKGNYSETDEPDAMDNYGRSKYLGEVLMDNCLTIRTSIIGRELDTSHSLVEWFLSNRGKKVRGFTRAIYSGFPTVVFAEIIARIIKEHPELEGLHHIASEPIGKHDLLNLINEAYDANIEIEPDDEFEIDRSLNSTKFQDATGFVPESWETMIARMAADATPYESFHRSAP